MDSPLDNIHHAWPLSNGTLASNAAATNSTVVIPTQVADGRQQNDDEVWKVDSNKQQAMTIVHESGESLPLPASLVVGSFRTSSVMPPYGSKYSAASLRSPGLSADQTAAQDVQSSQFPAHKEGPPFSPSESPIKFSETYVPQPPHLTTTTNTSAPTFTTTTAAPSSTTAPIQSSPLSQAEEADLDMTSSPTAGQPQYIPPGRLRPRVDSQSKKCFPPDPQPTQPRDHRFDLNIFPPRASPAAIPPVIRGRGVSTSSSASQRSKIHQVTPIGEANSRLLRNGSPTMSSSISSKVERDRGSPLQDVPPYLLNRRDRPPPWHEDPSDEMRGSVRSGFTASSGYVDTSATERSSIQTKNSSLSDFPQPPTASFDFDDKDMSIEDVIGMYENGFEDDPDSAPLDYVHHPNYPSPKLPGLYQRASDDQLVRSPMAHHSPVTSAPRSSPLPSHSPLEHRFAATRPAPAPPSLSTSHLPLHSIGQLPPPAPPALRPTHSPATSISLWPAPSARTENLKIEGRDRYGFKKASQYITEREFDVWDGPYSDYLDRRRKKWLTLMKQQGFATDHPLRFPPRSDKMKRFIRKGIPPDWRGAAWFWYAGGPQRLAQNPNLYRNLLQQVEDGSLSESDREHIERDLHRTFPDNARFKPDVIPRNPMSTMNDTLETPIIMALRRVLQTFAVHNPGIGYCQSLNFLAGLLLLFLDEDEEKVFIMLNIITNEHLPGTHGIVLANVDIGVLMVCIRESMPAIWAKINDVPETTASQPGPRLPTVSLATTAWFMSCFVGNLPIETVLRVWDVFFYEGSKTLFRIALAVFKLAEPAIRAINDPLETSQLVQSVPRKLIDASSLMHACFRRRNGFGHLSQATIDARRADRRKLHAEEKTKADADPVSRVGLASRAGPTSQRPPLVPASLEGNLTLSKGSSSANLSLDSRASPPVDEQEPKPMIHGVPILSRPPRPRRATVKT